jgi:hypothetical protein
MRFVLSRSGGFAAVRRPPLVIDTASLPQDEATSLESLAGQANLHDLPPELPGDTQPDAFGYELRVTHDDGQETSVSFDHKSAPESLRTLVSALRAVKDK